MFWRGKQCGGRRLRGGIIADCDGSEGRRKGSKGAKDDGNGAIPGQKSVHI